jgi:uroporphyrinogen decarboxylase
MALQGNLDPQLVVAGGAALETGVRAVVEAFKGSPHIFNLGHGITPQTPPEHLGALINTLKGR